MSWKCPKCTNTRLNVFVTADARLMQEDDENFETEVVGDHFWDDKSTMFCRDCGYSAPSVAFEEAA